MLFKKKKKEDIEPITGLDFSPWPNMTEPDTLERKQDYEYVDGVGAVPIGEKTYNWRGYELTQEQWDKMQQRAINERHGWEATGSPHLDTLPFDANRYLSYNSTGTVPYPSLHLDNPRSHNLEFDVEALWEKMYEHAMAVIVVCDYCGTPQAIANGTCMRCGGALPKPKPLGR